MTTFRLLAFLALPAVIAAATPATDNHALLQALIRKGILTQQEAEAIQNEVARAPATEPVRPAGGHTRRLALGMRLQVQYAHLPTEIDGAPSPAVVDHTALRRMYPMLRANVGEQWGATVTYDLASSSYDEAVVTWKPATDLSFDFGLRKVNVAYEERASSGNIRALERSAVTRYFVEANNGRRLGAASYRVGVFFDGRHALSDRHSLVYGAAVTNPERNETFSGASGFGDAANNTPAWWANAGVSGRLAERGTWFAGVGLGHLPDQGGAGVANLGRGHDLDLFSLHLEVTLARATLMAEYLEANVARGASAVADARPRGYFVQPTLFLTPTIEAVLRYAWLDSDRRGVSLADGLRSAAGGGTMNELVEWFAGANWYLQGNDLKLQLGAVHGRTRESTTGAAAEATTTGVRSQVQLQF